MMPKGESGKREGFVGIRKRKSAIF